MKRTIIIATGIALLVGGCSSDQPESPWEFMPSYPHQNIAPWPWVHIVPSQEALAFKEIEFYKLSNQIHYDMTSFHNQDIYANINLMLLDYGILPTAEIKNPITLQYKGKKYSERNEKEIPRYFITARFYERNKRPPCPPLYEMSVSIWKNIATPQEAMELLVHEIMKEINIAYKKGKLHPGWKITLNLD